MEELNIGIGSRVKHPEFGDGVVIQIKASTYVVTFISFGIKEIAKSFQGLVVVDEVAPETDVVSFYEVERSLVNILRKFSDIQEIVPLSDKWRGGKIVIIPGNTEMKSYELPIDNFFHKIVMVRDRLRVLEQRVNASNLNDEEKVNIQQYITRIYGSLTSFNVLFKNKNDIFVGSKE
jgi:hypothetical protein